MQRFSEQLPRAVMTLFLLLLVPLSAPAAESGCNQAAASWIEQLADTQHRELLLRYTDNDCRFAGKWVKQAAPDLTPAHREQMCNDLVLIWSHKDCNYFRDVINPDAAVPCNAWSRDMYRHCMQNEADWFP